MIEVAVGVLLRRRGEPRPVPPRRHREPCGPFAEEARETEEALAGQRKLIGIYCGKKRR